MYTECIFSVQIMFSSVFEHNLQNMYRNHVTMFLWNMWHFAERRKSWVYKKISELEQTVYSDKEKVCICVSLLRPKSYDKQITDCVTDIYITAGCL